MTSFTKTSQGEEETKSNLIDRLNSLVQQCESRFSNRYELATEYEATVASLCRCLEDIFGHGFRRQQQTSSRLKILNGFTSSNSSTTSKTESSAYELWHFISQYLTDSEVQRFVSLRNVNTDFGRGRSWLRNALNEHSLEKYLSIILAEDEPLLTTSSTSTSSQLRRKQAFYENWALLLDQVNSSRLISAVRPLSGVLFALSIDRPDLDVCEGEEGSLQAKDPAESRLMPVKKKSSTPSSSSVGVQAALAKKLKKKKSTVVTINDEEEEELESSDLENGDLYAKSAPVPSFMKFAASGSSSPLNSTPSKALIASQGRSPSSLSIADGDGTSKTMVLYPISNQGQSPSPSDTTSESLTTLSDHLQRANLAAGEPSFPSSPSWASKQLQEKIDLLQLEREKILRDNCLLKIQLNKYLAALELLKYKSSSSGRGDEDENASTKDNQVEVAYEKKLVQVSEMHGELVEFNEHLYRVIQQKDSIIGRLRDELVELRGPLPDNDEILSISSEAGNSSVGVVDPQASLIQLALIHVWIPTAFLSGGFSKGKSHHIYQIYLRIKEEEWNVYRRYSQFYALHKSLKERHPAIGGFEFPPKKALGNKDSKVVQERRKKLETYLRNVLNYLQTQGGSGGDLGSKEKLITAVPFLSDKFFLQDRSHSLSDTNLNASSSRSNTQTSQQQQSPHYMGF